MSPDVQAITTRRNKVLLQLYAYLEWGGHPGSFRGDLFGHFEKCHKLDLWGCRYFCFSHSVDVGDTSVQKNTGQKPECLESSSSKLSIKFRYGELPEVSLDTWNWTFLVWFLLPLVRKSDTLVQETIASFQNFCHHDIIGGHCFHFDCRCHHLPVSRAK